MAKILYAWELGGGYGHIGKDYLIGEKLEGLGHQLSYVMRDLPLAQKTRPDPQQVLLQAPVFSRPSSKLPTAENYSDVLLRCGFSESSALAGLVRGWRELFKLLQPDLVLFDHAPTAMLSALTLKLPGLNIGSGFTVPPADQEPMPTLQPWKPVDRHSLLQKDQLLLKSMNQVLADYQLEPFDRVGQLFSMTRPVLLTWPELDHYAQRGEQEYLGPILETHSGNTCEAWAASSHPKVFVYLSATYKHYRKMIEQLRGRPISVLSHVRDTPTQPYETAQLENVHFSSRPLDLNWVLQHADLVVCHGGQTTTALTLKSGTRMLMLPQHLEQAAIAISLHRQKLVNAIPSPKDDTNWAQVIEFILSQSTDVDNLENFRHKYREHDSEQVVENVLQRIIQQL